MKIIDLLNKIANGEEVPEKIYCFNREFYWRENTYFGDTFTLMHYIQEEDLNDEVEILEEEKKFTKEDFIKEAMHLEDITREEFNKRYEVKKCNCGREYCKGFIKVEKVQEEKKIPEKLYDIVNLEEGICKAPSNEQLMYKINEIIDYLKSKGE